MSMCTLNAMLHERGSNVVQQRFRSKVRDRTRKSPTPPEEIQNSDRRKLDMIGCS